VRIKITKPDFYHVLLTCIFFIRLDYWALGRKSGRDFRVSLKQSTLIVSRLPYFLKQRL